MKFEELQRYKPMLEKIAKRYGVSDIRVFGSVACGTSNEDSDVDFLIKMEKDRSAFDMGGFQYHSSQLLNRHVDVIMDNRIYEPIAKQILEQAKPL